MTPTFEPIHSPHSTTKKKKSLKYNKPSESTNFKLLLIYSLVRRNWSHDLLNNIRCSKLISLKSFTVRPFGHVRLSPIYTIK